jgi:hypothetical protein
VKLSDLLKSLHALDEKALDMDVLVSPASGGYEGVSHVSSLYVGHAVIHLAEPQPGEPPPDLWESQESDVPAVSAVDLRNMYKLFCEAEARNPGQSGSIGSMVYQSVCSPGADVVSVWYRASMLGILTKMMPELLAKWTHNGQPDDVVFEIAAAFPMEKMRTGVVREGPPLDVDEFVKQIAART